MLSPVGWVERSEAQRLPRASSRRDKAQPHPGLLSKAAMGWLFFIAPFSRMRRWPIRVTNDVVPGAKDIHLSHLAANVGCSQT